MSLKLKTQGNEAFSKGEYKKAAKIYRDAIKIDGSNPILYSNRAMCFIKLKDWPRVIKDCEQGLELEPDSKTKVKLLWRLGIAYVNLNDYDKARNNFYSALEIDKNNATVLKELQDLNTKVNQKTELSNEHIPIVSSFKIPITEVQTIPANFGQTHNKACDNSGETNIQRSIKDSTSTELRDRNKSIIELSSTDTLAFPSKPSLIYLSTLKDLPYSDGIEAYQHIRAIPIEYYGSLYSKSGIDSDFLEFFLNGLNNVLGFSREDSFTKDINLLSAFSNYRRFDLSLSMYPEIKLNEIKSKSSNIIDPHIRKKLSDILNT